MPGALIAAAPNDAFDNPVDLGSVAEWSASVDTAAATVQVGEPEHPGMFSQDGTLWWTWTAPPEEGELAFHGDAGVAMELYEGDRLDALVRLESTDQLPDDRRPVEAGKTYRLMVGDDRAAARVGFTFHPRQPNDDFAHATDLGDAAPRTVAARLESATREPDEPEHRTPNEGGSLWWRWTVPTDGVVRLDFPDAPIFGWSLAAYRGTELGGLTLLDRASSQDSGGAVFRLSAGETIHLALSNSDPSDREDVSFRLDLDALVNNDAPEDALDLGAVASASFSGRTTAATPEPGGDTSSPTIWWRWSPPVNGHATIRLLDSVSFTEVSLFRLLPDGGREVIAKNFHPLRAYCRADETYLIRLESSSDEVIDLDLDLDPAPPNDDVAGALPLPFSRTEIDLSFAGSEPGEPFEPALSSWIPRSVWWRWAAPTDGALIAAGDLFAEGDAPAETPADLSPVPRAAEASDRHSVTAGQTYFLARWAAESEAVLPPRVLDPVFVPLTTGHDEFADAAPLGDATASRAFADMTGATAEAGEPDSPDASLWWSWTAPFDGVLTIELDSWESSSRYTDDVIDLFTGTTPDSLTAVEPPPGWTNFNPVRAFAISAGTSYRLRVRGSSDRVPGRFDFLHQAFPLPHANAAFATPADLGDTDLHEENLIFTGATAEPGEPAHDPGSFPATASRWWTWTAPADLTVDLSGPLARVYVGSDLGSLRRVGKDLALSGGSVHRFPATAGNTYRIALVGKDGRPTFRLQASPAPEGDRFASPVDLGDALDASLSTDLVDHTVEPDEPGPLREDHLSHWWQWTAPRDGTVTIDGGAANGSWSLVAGENPAEAAILDETTDVPVSAGQSLRIRYHGWWPRSASAAFTFHPFEPNDDFAAATDLGSAEAATVTADPFHATLEPGEPGPLSGYQNPGSLWWTWTAPADGILSLAANAENSFDGAELAVYQGEALGDLVRSRETFARAGHFGVLAGSTYRIQAGAARPDLSGRIALELEHLEGVANDHWQRAADLGSGAEARGSGSLAGTTPESFSPDTSRAGTAWWRWTAPADGTAVIHVDQADGARDVLVFDDPASGTPLALTNLDLNLDGPALATPAAAGQTLWISVGTSLSSTLGSVRLLVNHLDRPDNDTPENAAPLAPDAPVAGSFRGATAGDAGDGNSAARWWEWTAPDDGLRELVLDGGELEIFTETAPGEWSRLAESIDGVLVWNAEAGETYRIAALAASGKWPDFSLSLAAADPVPNDRFADATPLTGGTLEIDSHFVEATAEPGEPDHAGEPAERSVWFAWTAPESEFLRLRLTAGEARIAVYTGDALGALTPVAAGGDEVRLAVTQGTTYRIAVDGSIPAAFSLRLDAFVPPPNDDFADRFVIPSDAPEFSGHPEFATTESGEPEDVRGSLWWEWTPEGSSRSLRDFRVEGPVGSGVKLWIHDTRNFPDQPPFLHFTGRELSPGDILRVSGGELLYFHLRATGDRDSSGPVTFRLRPTDDDPGEAPRARPVNDDFENAIDLGDAADVRSSAIPFEGITNQEGEPVPNSSFRGLWWSWTAPASGYYEIKRNYGATDALGVFTGPSLAELTEIPLNSGGDVFRAEAGTVYHIQALTRDWDFRFQRRNLSRRDTTLGFEIFRAPTSPPNDDFAAARDLGSSVNQSVSGHNVGATAEPGEPDHAGVPPVGSVWYRWTAPESGDFRLHAFGATMRAAIHTGPGLADLAAVASGVEPVEFTAVGGTRYLVALDSDLPETFSIRFDEVPEPVDPDPPANDDFADALALGGDSPEVPGTLRGTTVEAGEPLVSPSHVHSAWWSWTAPVSGPVSVSAPGVTVSAYLGGSLATLVPLAEGFEGIRFRAAAGKHYRIGVADLTGDEDFTLAIDQSVPSPPHDRFADARELSGDAASADLDAAGASREPGQPTLVSGASDRAVWAAWTAPATDYYDFTISSATTSNHTLEVFTGGSLDSLVSLGSSPTRFRLLATAGTRYSIALAARDDAELALDIRRVARPSNDDFGDRISLGEALDLTASGTTVDATREAGESPVNGSRAQTLWWSWTAPETGTFALEIEQGSPTIGIFTGAGLEDLTPVATSNFFGTLLHFSAEAGTTYQIALGERESDAGPVAFAIRGAPPANDDFADRITLDSTLPLAFGGRTSLATTEAGEPAFDRISTDRTVWWEWIAPADGAVDLIAPPDSNSFPHVFTGNRLTFLTPVAVTEPADGARRFEATAGTAYVIGFSGTSSMRAANRAEFELKPARPLPPNDDFADAIALGGASVASASHNWGAGVEPGEPADHRRSLWWTWTAPRDGSARVETDGTLLHLYRGDSLGGLVPAGNPFSEVALYPVEAGDTFRIAVGTPGSSGEIGLSIEMTPPGDDFHAALELPSIAPEPTAVDLSAMTWEPFEPAHRGEPAEHSAWFRWTAPDRQPVTIRAAEPATGTRLAVYTGDRLARLSPVAEGRDSVTFLPQTGQTYHFALDHDDGVAATLAVEQNLTGFAAWRAGSFPDPNAATAGPEADPDGDGRANVLEMALGTDPLAGDAGPTPVRIRDFAGYVTLGVIRPVGIDGLNYAFDVTPDLGEAWRDSKTLDRLEWTEARGDGTEEFITLLIDLKTADHTSYFARLRVETD